VDINRQSVRDAWSGEQTTSTLAEVAYTARALIVAAITFANLVGASIVVVLLGVILPIPEEAGGEIGAANVGSVIYIAAAIVVGTVVGLRLANPVITFFQTERQPTEAERRAVLRLPLVLLKLQAALWGGAVLVFGGIALSTSTLYAFEVAITTVLGGIPTASLAYLYTQRLLRGGAAIVLAEAPPRRREVPGVGARALLAWALGAVPAAGVLTLAAFATATEMTLHELARATIVLTSVTLAVGLAAIVTFARSVAEPLQRLRDAFADIEEGNLDVEVPVFDATEVGYASASFNRMAAGLREREKLRDLFGRQVGADVARQALEEGVTLGGEEREAAALFVDIIGSTTFAADRKPTEVVEALNRFFEVVVNATQAHGGLVNKFVGDAALCIFGAPLQTDDAAGAALAAAREMRAGLERGELDAAIGVAAGTVVAGNVGTADRYEYTVIGDPVNEAARLTELAKERDGRVLASEAAIEAAGEDERAHWELGEAVQLRGRSAETRLAEPTQDPATPA
jgi:adenylate cyclase